MTRFRMMVLVGLLVLNLAVLVGILVATGYRTAMPDCQEDEVIAWVADDVRGCVNAEEYVADFLATRTTP